MHTNSDKNENRDLSIDVLNDKSTFSLKSSLTKAFEQTLTMNYVLICVVWFILDLALQAISGFIFDASHDLNDQLIPLLFIAVANLAVMSGISVSWYRFLAFGEQQPIFRFGLLERTFFTITCCLIFFIGFITSILTLLSLGMTNAAGGVPVFIFFPIILFLCWLSPFIFISLGLVSMESPYKKAIEMSKAIVNPVHFELLIGYTGLFILDFCVLIGLSPLLFSLPSLVIAPLLTALRFLFTGLIVAFTSHVIYSRSSYERR